MKTILIATDFSPASRKAAEYGIRFAKATGAKIILFNAYKVPIPAAGLGVSVSRYSLMMQADKMLLEEAEFLNPKGTLIDILCDEGLAEQAILNAAMEKNVDIIITGMKGSSKSLKKLFGSTATALARNANIPLIIVPEDARFVKPGIIVFAYDGTTDLDNDIPGTLTSVTSLFGSKLYVVKVVKNKNEEYFEMVEMIKRPKKIMQVADTSFAYPVDTDIRHALNEFIKNRKADMLVMVPHKHGWLEHLIKKSETENMIFHTRIPLLILPEKDPANKKLQQATSGRMVV